MIENGYIRMATESVKEAIEADGRAQIAEKKAVWHPNFAGEWADAIEDWLSTGEAPAGSAEAKLAEGRVVALRFLQSEGRRPYCGTEKEWSWFDKSKAIDDMGDESSDMEPHLYAMLTGEVKTGYKAYPSGFAAIADFVEALAAWLASGKPWPEPAHQATGSAVAGLMEDDEDGDDDEG